MSVAEKLSLTPEDYLHGELNADVKHEYWNGEVWAMMGASDAHVTIAGNLFFLLKQFLKDKPCRTYISDMKLNVAEANAFFYPDVLVTCDARDQDREHSHYKQYPSFIAEVLSPSTEGFDRGQKFAAYRQLPSLQTYCLIDSRSKLVDVFSRTEHNDWLLHSVMADDELIQIPSLDFACSLGQLYEQVIFSEET